MILWLIFGKYMCRSIDMTFPVDDKFYIRSPRREPDGIYGQIPIKEKKLKIKLVNNT